MTFRPYIVLVSLVLIVNGCSNSEDNGDGEKVDYSINIIEKIDLKIPSGSGITGYKSGYLTVGDDTPWLYYLDSLGTLTDSLRLSNVEGYVPGVRMGPAYKADFECITRLNEDIVLVLGSGSYTSARDTAYLINAEEKRILAKKSMDAYYKIFAEMGDIDDVHALNIEGVSVGKNDIYFFNRGDLSLKSLIFKTDLAHFISYFNTADSLFVNEVYNLIPHNEEYGNSTFSSSVFIPSKELFIFSSTLEDGSRMDSNGVVIDGEIKGSFLGKITLDELNDSIVKATPIMDNGIIAPIKLEGLWLSEIVNDSLYHFIGVSDPDNGTTETFIIEVKINKLQ
jgi:hypothetical protein